MSSGLFHACFIAENVFMIVIFFTWSNQVIWNGGLRISSLHLSYCCPLSAHLYIWFLLIDFLANHVGNADLWGGKCRGISRRNYAVTIRFNAERPWKRLFTPGINHVGTSQGRMFARLQTRLILSWDQARPSLLTDPLFSLNKSPAVYILLRALDGFCGPPAQRGRGGGLKKRKRKIKHSLFTS